MLAGGQNRRRKYGGVAVESLENQLKGRTHELLHVSYAPEE